MKFTQLSGCFVATAAYGSEMEPQVAALRRVRDALRPRSPLFAAAADLYYRSGPAAAAVIARSDTARALARRLLGASGRAGRGVRSARSAGVDSRARKPPLIGVDIPIDLPIIRPSCAGVCLGWGARGSDESEVSAVSPRPFRVSFEVSIRACRRSISSSNSAARRSGEDGLAGAQVLPAEARRLRSRLHDDAEEAELGAPQGRRVRLTNGMEVTCTSRARGTTSRSTRSSSSAAAA